METIIKFCRKILNYLKGFFKTNKPNNLIRKENMLLKPKNQKTKYSLTNKQKETNIYFQKDIDIRKGHIK